MDARDFEVRCADCGAGFAIGTQRCIHCGARLGVRSLPTLLASSGAEPGEPSDPTEGGLRSNLLSGGIMLALVAASALMRACN
jgi:hypothetical protein